MKRRIGLDVIILVVFLIVFAVVSLQIAGRDTAPDDGLRPHRSTYSPNRGGWKAAFTLLEQSGIHTGRWNRPPASWTDTTSVMICGQEVFATGDSYWTSEQAQDAMEWVERGGTLIVMSSEPNAITDAAKVTPDAAKTKDGTVQATQPVPYLKGVNALLMPGTERFTSLGADATVLMQDAKPAVVAVKRGAGRVIFVSSPAVIDNAHLGSNDNARFLVQLVSAFNNPKRTDGVQWDEFHQGYQEERSFWNSIGQPGQFAAMQLMVLVLLICYVSGSRFGLARPAPLKNRLSSEYVTSLADLYRRARASDSALEGVYLSFWRDLCRAVGVSLDSNSSEVAKRAAASLGEAAYGPNASAQRAQREQKLLRLLQECETKIEAGGKKLPDSELLSLARAIEDMRKELELGRDERRD